jgi:hypothetical protein
MPREKIGPSAPRNRYTRAREAIEDGSAAVGVIAGARGTPRKPPFACTSDRLSRFCAAVCFIAELESAIARCALPSTRQTTSIAAAKKAATCLGQIGLAFTVRTVVIFGTRNAEVHGLLNAYVIANE